MSESIYTVRQYLGGEDYHMVNDWHKAHRDNVPLLETLLPPDGFIVQEDGEDIGAVWCYFANNIGVAHVEFLIMRPGNSLGQSKRATKALVDFLWLHASRNNYGALIFHTLPAVGRFADYAGLTVCGKGLITLMKTE